MLSSDLNFTAELTYMPTGMFPIRTSVYLLLITCCYCTVLFDKIFITCRLFCSPLPIEFSCQAVDTKTTKSPLGASTRDIIWVAAPQPVLCWGAAGRDISKGAQYASPTWLTFYHAPGSHKWYPRTPRILHFYFKKRRAYIPVGVWYNWRMR